MQRKNLFPEFSIPRPFRHFAAEPSNERLNKEFSQVLPFVNHSSQFKFFFFSVSLLMFIIIIIIITIIITSETEYNIIIIISSIAVETSRSTTQSDSIVRPTNKRSSYQY